MQRNTAITYKSDFLWTPCPWKELAEGYLPGKPTAGKRSEEGPL